MPSTETGISKCHSTPVVCTEDGRKMASEKFIFTNPKVQMRYYREFLLFEAIMFFILWLYDYNLATLLTFIIVPVCGSILLVSLIAEFIEKSRIGRNYFILMGGLTIIPIIIYLCMQLASEGTHLDWGKP